MKHICGCGIEFNARKERKSCSVKCALKYRHKPTPWNKGLKMPEGWGFPKGHKINIGKKYSVEHRKKISEARIGMKFTEEHKRHLCGKRADITKEKHPRWIGGSRSYYKDIGRRIMEQYLRRKLVMKEMVHHLDFNWRNNNIDNLYLFENRSKHTKYHEFLKKIVREHLI